MSKDDIVRDIDAAIAPPMSAEAALEFLEELADDIDARVEGLRADIKTKEKAR